MQAQKFGAKLLIPAEVKSMACGIDGGREKHLLLSDGRTLRARTVVVASGARYRRPAVARLAEFEGNGIWYWASGLEARSCADAEVALVGGGNSAGQAAVFLSQHARKVHMLVRGPGLAACMSQYLIDRIAAAPNIELLANTEIVRLEGDPQQGLCAVAWRDRRSGVEREAAVRHLFLFVGADPETAWLDSCGIGLDAQGFVLTGALAGAPAGSAPAALETSVPQLISSVLRRAMRRAYKPVRLGLRTPLTATLL